MCTRCSALKDAVTCMLQALESKLAEVLRKPFSSRQQPISVIAACGR